MTGRVETVVFMQNVCGIHAPALVLNISCDFSAPESCISTGHTECAALFLFLGIGLNLK